MNFNSVIRFALDVIFGKRSYDHFTDDNGVMENFHYADDKFYSCARFCRNSERC